MPAYAWTDLEDRLVRLSSVWNTAPLERLHGARPTKGPRASFVLSQYRRLVAGRPDFHDGSTVRLIAPRSARVGAGLAFYVDEETESRWLIAGRDLDDPPVMLQTAVAEGPPGSCDCRLSEALLLLALYRFADLKAHPATNARTYGGGASTFRVNPIRAKAHEAGLQRVGTLRTTALGAGNEWCDLFDGGDCVLAVRGTVEHPAYQGAAVSADGWQRLTRVVGAWGGVYRRGPKGGWKLVDE